MPAWSFVRCVTLAERHRLNGFRSMQCEYNPCHREAERELLPFCLDQGLAVVPFSPMARGFLCTDRRLEDAASPRQRSDEYTRKYYYRPADHAVFDRVAEVAAAHGVAPAQVSLAWTLNQPGVTSPIIGPTDPAHIDDAVAALSLRLTREDAERIEAAYQPRPTRNAGH
jgi:aryl-alcohol dehydrogenase-like predicted oxidoreductase